MMDVFLFSEVCDGNMETPKSLWFSVAISTLNTKKRVLLGLLIMLT